MALEPGMIQRLDHVVRALSTASRSLRLYPEASPIPRETVSTAVSALEQFFLSESSTLSLSVARDGFEWGTEPIAAAVQGARDLASELRGHGVALLDIESGVTADELLGFLMICAQPPDELSEVGGLGAAATAAGVHHVRVVDVHLAVAGADDLPEDGDYSAFLRELAADPDRLSAWFASASSGDPSSFEDGLMELMDVAGEDGIQQLVESMRFAFLAQSGDGKDALLGLSLADGPVRDMTGRIFGMLAAPDIAESVLGGVFGKNMLSLSNALTRLPLERATAEVRAEVQAMLPGSGHTEQEASFLQHMLEVRGRREAEQSLIDADRTYKAVVEASQLRDEDVARARTALGSSADVLTAASVRTMLSLLDQQSDFELYCAGADNLAGMVPMLIEQGDLALAARVLAELASRECDTTGTWPALPGRIRTALSRAVGPRSMDALVAAVVEHPELEPTAIEIVRHGGDTCSAALTAAAITHKAPGLDVADRLIGRRVIDQLHVAAGSAQWFQLAPIVTRLAGESDARSTATLEALLTRPDEKSRREVATALGPLQGPTAVHLLGVALRDSSADVAVVAAKAIARGNAPGAATLLASRLGELDIDTTDFMLARELIAGLARIPGPEADGALAKLASRRVLIKRGHYGEVQQLVSRAQAVRAEQGVTQ